VDRADASGLESPVASVLPVDKDLSELVGSGASVEPRWCSGLDSKLLMELVLPVGVLPATVWYL